MARPTQDSVRNLTLPRGTRIACVSSRYHAEVVDRMRASARRVLEEAGLDPASWWDVEAPGAFELPLLAQRLARRSDVDGVLTFGLVLKGETDHDRYISAAVSDALMRIGLETDKPVMFGLLTCPTLDHALRRARTEAEDGLDKGREVATALLETLVGLEEIASQDGGEATA